MNLLSADRSDELTVEDTSYHAHAIPEINDRVTADTHQLWL